MTNIIGDKGNRRYDPNLAERVNKEIELKEVNKEIELKERREVLEQKLEPKTENKELEPKQVIIPNDNSWTIENDEYKIQLSKSLIPFATWEKQISDYIADPTTFKPANYQELFLIGKILYDGNINQKDEILKFLRESFNKYMGIQTLSGILYKPIGDEIIHDKGMSSEYKMLVDFRGPTGLVEPADEEVLKYLTGLNNLDEIKEISQFLANGTQTEIWRSNSKPEQDTYRIAWFNAGSDSANLDCYANPRFPRPALGVRVEKKF